MNIMKTLMAMAFLTVSSQALLAQTAEAQTTPQESHMNHDNMNHGDMNHDGMNHSNMNHGEMTHDHTGQEKPVLNDEAVSESATVIVAKVNGLVCDFCAQALKKVFKKEDAVESLNVDLDKAEVLIGLKAGQTLDDEKVKKLIRKSGYSLVSLDRVKKG